MTTAQRFGSTASDTCRPPPQPNPCTCTTHCRHSLVTDVPLRRGVYCRERAAAPSSQAIQDQLAAEAMHEHRMYRRAVQVVVAIGAIILLSVAVGVAFG